MKSVAILVPSYNSAHTLEATFRSILALPDELSEFVDFVMLSDDGSKDNTVALAESLWTDAPVPLQIRRVSPNGGEYRNVNGAIAAMPGHIDWVLIMHADNHALPGWIRVLASECARSDARTAAVCASYQYVLDDKVVDPGDMRGVDAAESVEGTAAAVRGTILKGCWWHNSASAIRVSLWKAIGGHPQETPLLSALEMLGLKRMAEPPLRKLRIKGDWDTSLRMLSAGFTLRYVPVPVMRYVEVSTSVSAGSFAWHGDLLETLQVLRRHQGVLSLGDIWRMHLVIAGQLARRTGGALLRRDLTRMKFGIQAFPSLFSSLLLSHVNHFRRPRKRLDSIPFGADRSPL